MKIEENDYDPLKKERKREMIPTTKKTGIDNRGCCAPLSMWMFDGQKGGGDRLVPSLSGVGVTHLHS